MVRREASINDVPLRAEDRKFFWEAPGARPAGSPGLTDLGL
jgi:nuclear transport factor 2 (NTF2) superfamily protein